MTTDRVMPEDKWVFDQEVTDAFSDMLNRSIPQYEGMRKIVTHTACQLLPMGPANLMDLGTSRGEVLWHISNTCQNPFAEFTGVEISHPMAEAAKKRFKEHGDMRVSIVEDDLRSVLANSKKQHVITSVLTLMFTPIEHRSQILREIRDALYPDGSFILVEKLTVSNGKADVILRDAYWDHKREMGYDEELIVRKAASLEGVLVPQTYSANEAMLRDAGFAVVESIWRWGPFCAWLALKEF